MHEATWWARSSGERKEFLGSFTGWTISLVKRGLNRRRIMPRRAASTRQPPVTTVVNLRRVAHPVRFTFLVDHH